MVWEIHGRHRSGHEWVYQWEQPIVMGVVNVTPDSFSDGGHHADTEAAVAHGRRLIDEGAQIVDVGGESTRPGATPVPEETEMARVIPVIEQLAQAESAIVSVDTRHPTVALAAVEAGAQLVNDVSGLRSPEMVDVCASTGTPAVIMHMLGDPATMQRDPRYGDVVTEVGE